MFTHEEIQWLLDCFNGVICSPSTIVPNIHGWVMYAKNPLPPELILKVNGFSPEVREDFRDQVCAWQEYQRAYNWLKSL
jgi:hypothetical protein